MISKSLAEKLNHIIAESSGGTSGIRDENLLLSAINRPFQTFDGVDLYPETTDKAAAIFKALLSIILLLMVISVWHMLLCLCY